jgi:DNA-binding NtrC family response regulator
MQQKVAIIDDDVALTELTSGILRDAGMEVERYSATVFADVLEKENFDIVLLDMWMDERRSGFTLAQHLQRNAADAFRLFLMSSDPRVEEWAERVSAEGYFKKPLDYEQVVDTLLKRI